VTISSVLTALAAIPQIAGYIQSFASAVVLWYVNSQNNEALAAIADAAALGAKAKTDADRYAAALAWQNALNKPRVSST